MERILCNVVGIELIDSSHNTIDIGLQRLCEKQELDPRHCLETRQPKVSRLQDFYTGTLGWRKTKRRWSQRLRYCMDTIQYALVEASCKELQDNAPVKGTCEYKVVIGRQLVEGRVEVFMEHEAASFVDDDQ